MPPAEVFRLADLIEISEGDHETLDVFESVSFPSFSDALDLYLQYYDDIGIRRENVIRDLETFNEDAHNCFRPVFDSKHDGFQMTVAFFNIRAISTEPCPIAAASLYTTSIVQSAINAGVDRKDAESWEDKFRHVLMYEHWPCIHTSDGVHSRMSYREAKELVGLADQESVISIPREMAVSVTRNGLCR